jgi:transposase
VAYLYGERKQRMMFPPSLEEYVSADDPVRAYDAFVERLDFKALGVEVESESVGAPEYYPRAMMKLLVYGYSYGIRSSRKLERATYHNVSFVWLMGGLKPDHKTIARFRRDHREALKQVLKQCVRMCMKLSLIEGNTLFVDGTKIRGNASLGQSWTKKKGEKLLKKTDERIERILAECEATDQAEAGRGSQVHMEEGLKDAQKLKDKIEEVLKELEGGGQKSINTTDRDCRNMKSRRGVIAGYNMQSVVDDGHGLIVNADVVTDANDCTQFKVQIEEANGVVGRKCKVACGDAGYASTQELKGIDEQGIRVIVPSQDQARRKPPRPFSKGNFMYDSERDCYVCPEGQVLRYRKTDLKAGQRVYQITHFSICHGCRFFGECTKAKQGRAIGVLIDEEAKKRFEAEYEKPESQEIYKRRKARVEHPFGHFKRNLGIQSFLLRGLRGVRAEASILATCFNLTRMITIMGVKKLVQEWRIG